MFRQSPFTLNGKANRGILQTVEVSIMAFTPKDNDLVERYSASVPLFSSSKQSGEAARCKFCVAYRMRDVLVPEIILDQSGVRAPVSEGISAWVPCVCA
jgi:hypothetical protein